MTHKVVLDDPAVKAAIENLKRAAMAVNGATSVKNTLILLDLRYEDIGKVLAFADICPCDDCIRILGSAVTRMLADAARNRVSEDPGKAVLQ